MPKSRVLAGALVAGAVAVTSMFAAAPAGAATLPAGQKITVIDQFDAYSQFYEASPADAALTEVGSGQVLYEDNLTAVDVDDDGYGYAIGTYDSEGTVATLYDADANTGVLSDARMIMIDFGDDDQVPADYCSALDYTAGVLTGICFYGSLVGEEWVVVAYWGVLDPDAAVGEAWLTPLYAFADGEYLEFTAMAVDPVSGEVFALADYDGMALFILSEDDGADFVTWVDRYVFGFDFDRSGQAWVTTWIEVGESTLSGLATLNLEDGTLPFLAPMWFDGDGFGEPLIQPITVWGKEVLPATGASNTLVLGGAAAAVLLLGAILAAGALAGRRGSTQA